MKMIKILELSFHPKDLLALFSQSGEGQTALIFCSAHCSTFSIFNLSVKHSAFYCSKFFTFAENRSKFYKKFCPLNINKDRQPNHIGFFN